MAKAFFICYGGGHADAIIPIIKYLMNKTDIQIEAIGVNLAADKLRKAGIPCKSLSNYLNIRSVEIGFPLAKERHNFNSGVSFADSIAYYGFTMSDLIDEIGEKAAYQILDIFDRRTMFPVQTMMRILDFEQPDVVITTTMNRFEAATLCAAGKMGIPSVKVEDLIGKINKTFPDKIQVDTEEERQNLIASGFKPQQIILKSELEDPIVMGYYEIIHQRQLDIRPTAFAVLCNYAKKIIVERGVEPKSIYITGQPAFDRHPEFLENSNKYTVSKKLGVNPNLPLVIFMSQPNREREEVFRTLVEAITILPPNTIEFVVKLHPNEDGKIQRLILSQLHIQGIHIVKNIDSRELIAVSDMVVTVSSTTGLEAAVMGKTLVYINVTDRPDVIPFKEMGIGLRCSNVDELYEMFKLILIDKVKVESPCLSEYHTDGKAAQRVGEIIQNLAYKNYMPIKRAVVIIQARMNSTRLPGKVLKNICGKPQIQHVVDRMKSCKLVSDVVVATSVDPSNDILVEYLLKNNINFFVGSENDVLLRYIKAGKKYGAEVIIRVTGDNPMTDPGCVDKMIESHLQTRADYSTIKGLPLGVTASAINMETLERIYQEPDLTDRDKEHVTIYAYEHRDRYKINYIQAPSKLNHPELSMTVDTLEEFDRICNLYNDLYNGDIIKIEDAIQYFLEKRNS